MYRRATLATPNMAEKRLNLSAPLLSARRHPTPMCPKHDHHKSTAGEVAKPSSVPFLWEQIPGRAKGGLAPEEPKNTPRLLPSSARSSLRRFSGEVNSVRQHTKFFSGELGAACDRGRFAEGAKGPSFMMDRFIPGAEAAVLGPGLVKNKDEDGEGSGTPRSVVVVQSCGFFRWPLTAKALRRPLTAKVLRQLNPMPAIKIKTTKALASAGRLVKYASLGSTKLMNAKPVPPMHYVRKPDPTTRSCELTRIETKPAGTPRPMFYSGELNSRKPSLQARNRSSPYRSYKRSVSPRMNAPCSTLNNDIGYTTAPKRANHLSSNKSMPNDRAEDVSTHLFPPPLPRSPSESWLTQNLSAASPRKRALQTQFGTRTQPKKQADQMATTEDTKWEAIVKNVHLVYDYGLDSEELVARVPRRARTRK